MYKIITCNRGIIKTNKDKIEMYYTPKGRIITKTKVLESSNYEYWYDYEKHEGDRIEITSLNIEIDGILYKNVHNIIINDRQVVAGVFEGYTTIERVEK